MRILMPTEGVYLGVKTCEVFLCFLAIVSVRVCYVDCFLCFTSLVSVRGSYSEDEPTEAKASRARSVIHARGKARENLIFRAHSPFALASLSPLFVLNTPPKNTPVLQATPNHNLSQHRLPKLKNAWCKRQLMYI